MAKKYQIKDVRKSRSIDRISKIRAYAGKKCWGRGGWLAESRLWLAVWEYCKLQEQRYARSQVAG